MLKERTWIGWVGIVMLTTPWMLNVENEWLWYAAQAVVLLSLSRVFILVFFLAMLVLAAMVYSVTFGAVPANVSSNIEVEMAVYGLIVMGVFLDLMLRRKPLTP